MATLSSVLKSVGKDLSHVGTWIDDGLKAAGPVIGTLDPPLLPIITEVESVLGKLPTSTTGTAGSTTATVISAATLQAIVTAVATLESIKSAAVAPASAA
jgi:hypothetical protein